MDSCICSEGIRFLEAAQSPRAQSRDELLSGTGEGLSGLRLSPTAAALIANVPIESFPQEMRHRLGWYVYRLIDPRNGETFQARVSPQLGSAQHSPTLVSTPLCVYSGHPARLPMRDPSRSSVCR